MSYTKILFDKSDQRDSCQKTDIQLLNSETGECMFRVTNKIVLPGAAFTARAHFDLGVSEITPTYNEKLGLENTVNETPSSLERCYLFAVGTDGCGRENSQLYVENYAKWIPPESLVPLQYRLKNNDLSPILRDKYFGRKEIADRFVYYFKAFETKPIFIQQFIDGTEIDKDVYTTTKTEEVESYVEIILKITKTDCRDFFIATTGISDARINTVSLLTAWAKNVNGHIYYQDIRPLTKLNIPNEALIDLTKGIDIIYHIYY